MVEMLYFTAAWCGPCKQMAPIIAELRSEGRLIKKIDVDESPDMARQYGVMGMPTFIIVKDGRTISRVVGAKPKWHLENEFRMAESA